MYFRPRTLSEAVDVLGTHGGQILSGGTDFFPALGDRPVVGPVVDVSGLSEIKGIAVAPDHVRIGGLTTWSEVVNTPLPRCFDALKSAAREIGGIQIQNRGTVAGNLCNASPRRGWRSTAASSRRRDRTSFLRRSAPFTSC